MRKEEKELSAREVASQLGIAESTLRRWLNMLHTQGYVFAKDGNRRKLYEQDLNALLSVKELNPTMSLEEACREVCKKKKTKRTTSAPAKQSNSPDEKQSVDHTKLIQQLHQFDQSMADLSIAIYWKGTASTVDTLKSEWEQFKEEIEKHFQ